MIAADRRGVLEHGRFEHGHDLWSSYECRSWCTARASQDKQVDTIVEHVDLVAGLAEVAGADMGSSPV